jgi:plastocyanin
MRVALISALTIAACTAHAADLTVTVLDRNGKPLPDVVVLVDSSAPGARPAPVMEATIAQEKLRFVPAVTVVSRGAKVSFSNLDSWDHHVILGVTGPGDVYVDPGQNTQFRLAGRVAGKPPAVDGKVLNQSGAYLLGCHIHSSMKGHILVTDVPWTKLSGDDGKAVLQGVPEGPARVRIWHAEQLVEGAPLTVQVTASGGAVSIPTQISPARRKRPAADPYFGG